LVFWALLPVVSVEYLVFVLRAGDREEGGILSLTAMIARSSKVATRGVWLGLIMIGLFGTALLFGDGAITPAISVLAAVEGLDVSTSSLGPFVIPIAVAIPVARPPLCLDAPQCLAGSGPFPASERPGH
jgi:KUP system potassium uptake protein